MDKYRCCLCGKEKEGYGNNPWPLGDESKGERCCDNCNLFKVIPARLQMSRDEVNEYEAPTKDNKNN